jgi:hypothetical protein
MHGHCRGKLKKTFGGESLKPFRRVFRKPRRLGFSGSLEVR